MFKDKQGKVLSSKEVFLKIINRIANWFLDFELMVLRCVGYIPFHIIRKNIYRLFGVKIGRGSTIHMWANFFMPKNIKIGNDSIIGNNAFLDGRAPLVIGNHTDIASEVMIYNSEHNINSIDFSAREEKVEIGDYCFIGPRVIILPGVKIGKGCVIGAGAVVTKNITDFSVVGGVPAEVIGERKNKNPEYRLGRARLFQ